MAAATMVLQFTFWPVVFAVTASADEGASAGGALALGLALVPASLAVLAFGSRIDDAPMAILKAMSLFLVVALPIGLADVVLGLVAGFGAAGVVALRGPDRLPPSRLRWAGVGGAVVWIALLLAVAPGFALLSAAVLPFTVLAIVDQTREDRAASGDHAHEHVADARARDANA